MKSGLGKILPHPIPGGHLETLGWAWERQWEQGQKNTLLSFISMSLNCVLSVSELQYQEVRIFMVMSVCLITLILAWM